MGVKIGPSAIKAIEKSVSELFDRARARYLGPQSLDKRVYIEVNPQYTLPGIMAASAASEGAVADEELAEHLIQTAGLYLNAYEAQAKAQVLNDVRAVLDEALSQGVSTDLETVLGGRLSETWATVSNNVKRMIDTEATHARNLGALDGIVGVNLNQGIEDPVVFFVVCRDDHLCSECKRLHLMPDEVTPRLWYMSELKQGYHKKGEPMPSVSGEHPNCRCGLATLMPGYGFGPTGRVKFISLDHDEMAAQRGLKKSDDLNKGAMRRLFPFNPNDPKNQELKDLASDWQRFEIDTRGDFPEMSPEAKARALNKLHSLTPVKRHPKTGERLFLLHRGMGPNEQQNVLRGDTVKSKSVRSWTPRLDTATSFAGNYLNRNPVPVSAWIPESKIKMVLPQYGNPNGLSSEHEVLVEPHESELVNPDELYDLGLKEAPLLFDTGYGDEDETD